MSALFKILLSFIIISCFTVNIVVADEGLEYYKKLSLELSKYIEALEKETNYLQKNIKYWEQQLTGIRRFFYPRKFGIRNMVEQKIKNDKTWLVKKNKLMVEFMKRRKVVNKKIVDIETDKGFDKGSFIKIHGTWNTNYFVKGKMVKYNIQQNFDSFSWSVSGPGIAETTKDGKLVGNEISIMYNRTAGPGQTGGKYILVKGTVVTEKGGNRAIRIIWGNGVIWTRQ